MIRIDALYFLLVLEALILMTGLSFFLYLTIKRERTRHSSPPPIERCDFCSSLQSLIDGYLMDMKLPASEENGLSGSSADREKLGLNLRFGSVTMDSAHECAGSPEKFWDRLMTGYGEIAHDMLKAKDELVEEITSLKQQADKESETEEPADGGGSPAPSSDGHDDLDTNNSLKDQIRRLVENIEAKTVQLTDLQARFDSLEQEYLVLYKESLK